MKSQRKRKRERNRELCSVWEWRNSNFDLKLLLAGSQIYKHTFYCYSFYTLFRNDFRFIKNASLCILYTTHTHTFTWPCTRLHSLHPPNPIQFAVKLNILLYFVRTTTAARFDLLCLACEPSTLPFAVSLLCHSVHTDEFNKPTSNCHMSIIKND